MSMDKTSLSKNNKYKKAVLWWLLCFVGLFILFVCIYFLAWGMMMQPKPSYQPQLSNKEERYFKALDKRKGWSNTTRFIKNINNEGERMFDFENGDINIMLSMINMKLRDEFSSLESFANYYSLSKEEIIERLEEKGYQYNENENQFKRV